MSYTEPEKEPLVVEEASVKFKQALSMFTLILLLVVSFWISRSPFMSAFSLDWVLLIGFVIFVGGLFTCYKELNPMYVIILGILFITSGLLINWNKDSWGVFGVVLLIISVILAVGVVVMEAKKTGYDKIKWPSVIPVGLGGLIVVITAAISLGDFF